MQKLAKKYNKDGTISLIANRKVVFKATGLDKTGQIQSFIKGWYGADRVIMNKPIFVN